MIEFRNVSKTYDTGTEAVHKANFNIEKGEFSLSFIVAELLFEFLGLGKIVLIFICLFGVVVHIGSTPL